MTMPKSKLGFLLAAVYVFVAGSIFIYVKFVCNIEASLYCGTLGFKAVLPVIFFGLLLNNFLKIPVDFSIYLGAAITLLIIAVLFYFIGSFIQRKFSPKITRAVSIGLIIAAIVIVGILGIRYFNKSDNFEKNISTNVNNQINSRDYCQQDSDCVLVPQYQDCCPKGCEIEAVNIETKNRDAEARDKQYYCNLKKLACPQHKCVSSVNQQAICEQNRCVVKEKLVTESQSTINGLQFSINSDKTVYQYKKDEPITIYGEFKNITGKNIYFYTPELTLTVTYEVFDTKRKKIEIPSVIADPWPSVKEDFVLIRPNESLAKVFKVYLGIEEEVFVPDVYSIAVIYNNDITGYYENGFINLSGWSGKIKSNFIEIDIKADNKNLNQSNLKNYSIIGSFASPGESSFVKVLGSTAYLTDISEGLLAIDVSNPEKPVLLDKIKIGNGGAYALAVNPSGLFAMAGGYGNTKVALVDIINPKKLQIIDEIDAKRPAQDMVVIEDGVYLAIDGPEIEILELKFADSPINKTFILKPKTFTSKGVFHIIGEGHAIGLASLPVSINEGNWITYYLLVAQGEAGIGFYERAGSIIPQPISSFNPGYVNIVAADENYVYAGVGNSIKVIDLKTQQEIADIKVDDVWNFKVKNRTLYVASGENGVKVLDISDIRNPKQIAVIDTPGRARSVDVSADGKYIYVADDRDDLQIIKSE